jgi:prevent-host-death family protein
MQTWPVQDAKARFSELLDTCLRDGPQAVSRRGQEQAVLVPMAEWLRLTQQNQPGVKDLLLAEEARTEYLVPPRGQLKRRKATGQEG